MPKIARERSALEVKHLTRPGWHAVGGVAGLLLQVRQPVQEGAVPPRSWILRVHSAGSRHVIGLGPYPQVSLAQAREQARGLASDARAGVNLAARKRAQRSALIAAASRERTFRECAYRFYFYFFCTT